MTRVAEIDDDNRIVTFRDKVRPSINERPVIEETKPECPPGHELIGPDYRIEPDRVVAYWRVEQKAPLEAMADRLAETEARLTKLEDRG